MICNADHEPYPTEDTTKFCKIIEDGFVGSFANLTDVDRLSPAAIAVEQGSTLWITGGFSQKNGSLRYQKMIVR